MSFSGWSFLARLTIMSQAALSCMTSMLGIISRVKYDRIAYKHDLNILTKNQAGKNDVMI